PPRLIDVAARAQDIPARGADFGDDLGHVGVGSAVIDEAGPQREAAGNRGVRQIDAAALDDPPQDGRVDPVQVALDDTGAISEADGAQLDWSQQLEVPGVAD